MTKLKLPSQGADGIYGDVFDYGQQENERELRENVASKVYSNYLEEISKHHSIPVMDAEVERFLRSIPQDGWVLDLGGCWGWHWRNISKIRPDVKVVIVDLVRGNLFHAKNILEDGLEKSFYLVHGNAVSLDFENESFDGVWSVQTTQHIQDYRSVLVEVYRVLKRNGKFFDYNLNIARLTQIIYRVLGKKYHLEGDIEGSFFLRRANKKHETLISDIFSCSVRRRYTEVLFSPELGLSLGGRENSPLGKLDAFLSHFLFVLSFIARQKSFHVKKS